MNIKRIGQSAVSLLLLLLMLFTGLAGGMGETVKEPVTFDLTGDEKVFVDMSIFVSLMNAEGDTVSPEMETMDFNGDGTADVFVEMNDDGDFLLKRLEGADLLTKDSMPLITTYITR